MDSIYLIKVLGDRRSMRRTRTSASLVWTKHVNTTVQLHYHSVFTWNIYTVEGLAFQMRALILWLNKIRTSIFRQHNIPKSPNWRDIWSHISYLRTNCERMNNRSIVYFHLALSSTHLYIWTMLAHYIILLNNQPVDNVYKMKRRVLYIYVQWVIILLEPLWKSSVERKTLRTTRSSRSINIQQYNKVKKMIILCI